MITRVIIMCILGVIYGVLGSFMEKKRIIVAPSFWALYGALFGIAMTSVITL